jgi:serine/threonine protein phosphatase PrpC
VALARSGTGPEDAARLLQTRALERGSMDNITVVVLDLRGYTALCGRSRLSIVRVLDRALVAA